MEEKLKKLFWAAAIFMLTANFAYAHKITVVQMGDDYYEPQDLTIHAGDTIIFENVGKNDKWPASNIHPTHEIYSEFDPKKSIPPGQRWEFIFNKEGLWQYHDHLYPQIGGTITVAAETETTAKTETVKLREGFFEKIRRVIFSFFKKIGLFLSKSQESKIEFINKDAPEIFSDENALKLYIQNHGINQAMIHLHSLSSRFGSCHDQAHIAGRITYELYGDLAFRECRAECHSGCYHGATEAYFKERGTSNLDENLKTLCGSELNPFFSHQCVHGIGHGLMAFANYDIFKALESCDLLPARQNSCWTGVFMENIVGGLATKNGERTGHFTKYLNSNPHYPCDIVDEKYKNSCYFLQTSRMVQLFGPDFKEISAVCLEAPEKHQYSCFSSMGRDIGGNNRKNPDGAILACSHAPKGALRNNCLMGAVQDSFWDPGGQDDALTFCKLLKDQEEKDSCYNEIFNRAPDILDSKQKIKNFCRKAENDYKIKCLEKLQ